MGGRAVGLGGAYTALADDPTGVFFNPAGLVDQRRHKIQVSTNLYGLEIADSFFNAVGQVADLDTVFAELNIIPSSAAFAGELAVDKKGRPETSYGLGLFVPSFRALNVRAASEVDDPRTDCGSVTYNRNLSDRTFLIGASAAHRIDPTWSVGLSFFAAYRLLRESEDVSCSAGPTRFSTAATNVNLSIAALSLMFGTKVRLGSRWSLGATITSPSLRIYDDAAVTVRRGNALSTEVEPTFFSRELNDLSADTKFPFQARVGAAHVIPDTATFALDVTFYAGTSYDLFTLPEGEEAVGAAITTTRQVERNPIVNVNLGTEYLIVKEFSMALGLFTNLSSAPEIEGQVGDIFEENRLPHVHSAGGSLVLGFFSEYTLTRLGLSVSYGEGTDVVPRTPGLAALGQPDEFVMVDYRQMFLFVFISSSFRY